jgi:monoamine oxidase
MTSEDCVPKRAAMHQSVCVWMHSCATCCQAVATRWASDPLACGSYSSVAVGATGDDYDTMAQDVQGKVFFGGEATISRWPATMHGA